MSQFRDKASQFEQLGAQLIGISVDSFYSHAVFAQQLNLSYPLLSDFNRQVIPFYTGYYDDLAGLKGVGRRSVMVIDSGSTVRYAWTAPDPRNLPDVDEVIRAVRACSTRAVGQ